MLILLDESKRKLLFEVLQRRSPSMCFAIIESERLDLTKEQREELCHILTDELCASGLQSNYEPNQRGLLLEELIDIMKPWKE